MQQFDALNLECIPITLNKQVANFEIFNERPSLTFHIERMIEGRFNRLPAHLDAVNFIRLMIKRSSNLFISYLASLFILGKNLISDLDVFDILLPFVS
ncbi:hypothetical protein D3C73_1163180 [compost metagenome]